MKKELLEKKRMTQMTSTSFLLMNMSLLVNKDVLKI